MAESEAQMTAKEHAERISGMLHQAEQECAADIGRVSDPKAHALFETIREMLIGAEKALDDYAQQREAVSR